MRGVLIKFALFLIFAGNLVVPVFANAEGRVVFEVTLSLLTTPYWGTQSLTSTEKIAIKYRPQFPHSICEIHHKIRASNSSSNNLMLSLYEGPGIETSNLIEEIFIPASALPHHDAVYHPFVLSECITANPGEEYNFVFANETPNAVNYISGIRYGGSPKSPSKVKETDYFTYYHGGWHEDTSKDFSLLLKGYREPVVIIPGILGTRINNTNTGEEIWPGEIKIIGSDIGLNDLILGSDGITENVETEPAEIIKKEVKELYQPLIDQFSKYEEGQDLIIHPYDWRKDLSSEAMLLGEEIEKAASSSVTGKVSVVAHSMGGILAKEYFRQDGDTLVSTLVLMGSPKIGSPKAFKALNWGDNFDLSIAGIGLSAKRMKIIGQNMPSVYQLLPSREYINQEGHGYIQDRRDASNLKVLSFEAINDFMLEDPEDSRNESLLDLADNFHSQLDQFNFPQDKTYNIIVCQQSKTIGGFLLYPKGKVEVYFVDGDGTVPTLSGNYQSVAGQTYYALNNDLDIDHTGLVKNGATTALARKIVEGGEPVLENGISSSLADCANGELSKNKVISTHSPVIPHFYDTSGNHTGPDENGDIELGIPGSDYFIIRENHFGIMPEGIEFRVEIESTGIGTFDLKIKDLEGTEVVGLSTFIDIPIESIDQTATYQSDGETLYIDKTGDGESEDDQQLLPNASLSQEQANDTEPPIISIEGIESKEYNLGELIPFAVQAEDQNSGIELINTLLNDQNFEESTIDTSTLDLGEHILTVQAYDKAGNLAELSLEFSVTEASVTITLESIASSIQLAVEAGQLEEKIAKKLIDQLEKAQKEEGKITKVEEKGKENSEKKIEKINQKIDKILGQKLLGELEKLYNKGQINEEIYRTVKEGVEALME
ncbi:MAG: hypothetical protein Q8Q32_01000 [bacterium]|nr:hypothetical protein [bacterium]